MAFKMKNAGGAFKMMGSSPSPMKAKGDYVKPGGKATGDMKDYPLNSQERRDEYDARGWKHDDTTKVSEKAEARKKAEAEPTTTFTGDRTGKRTETETGTNANDQDYKKVTNTRRDGSVKKTVNQVNRSTWDPETQTGSSGLGIQETTQKYKKSGKPRKKTETTYSMGTDTKKDDKKVTTKVGKRKQTTKTKNASLHSGGTGTSKTKHYTKGKKAGTSVTKERKKGQLFGKKVDIDYS